LVSASFASTRALATAALLFAASVPGSAAAEELAPGVTPAIDYSGDWSTRPALSGDWGGLRQRLADRGLTFEVEWFQAGQGVVDGGIEERGTYVTNLDYYLKLDLMRMGLLPGALISARGQSRFGDTVNADSGLLLPVNTYSYFPFTDSIDEDVPIALTELNYLQFVTEEVGVLIGKITTMANRNEFAGGEGRTQFMNMQLLWSAAFAQVVPYSTLAVGGIWAPSPQVNVSTIFMNTKDASRSSGFGDIGDGTSWWTSADIQYRLGALPGGVGAGAVYAFDGDFAGIGGLNIDPGIGLSQERESSSWAFYASGWQYLVTEDPAPDFIVLDDGRQDLEGVGAFVMLGVADEDTNPISWSLSAGLAAKGPIPGRESDTTGLGYFYNRVQEPGRITGSRLDRAAQGLEFYYNVSLAQSIALSLDLQWSESAFAQVDDAVLLGVRLDVRF
jgi:porin